VVCRSDDIDGDKTRRLEWCFRLIGPERPVPRPIGGDPYPRLNGVGEPTAQLVLAHDESRPAGGAGSS
jgi:hypothetical protein